MPDPTASANDHVPPPGLPDPDLRPIDLAAPGSPDRLDDEARAHLARAGREALDDCLRRFTREEREDFWRAICRCYNRPYNAAETSPADTLTHGASPSDAAPPISPDAVPAPHVIGAVRPGLDGVLAEIALR